jgi:hypothetical protein
LPAGQAQTDGLSVGQTVANAIIAMRAHDGYDTFVDFTPQSGVGQWQPTPPDYDQALDPQWATLQPFAMTSDSQFRPAGPPDLTSQAWANAVNETVSLGSATSTTRTADQTEIAHFWADGTGTATPPGQWNRIAETVAQQQGDSLDADARLFAELDVAMGDAAIVAWDAKFDYTTWRPITVIQSGGDGVNSAVTADPNWQPLLVTPNFPEYISGHSTFSGAAAAVFDSVFGSNVGFTDTSAGYTRTYTSFDQAAIEAGRSRIYGGIHFEFSDADGETAGRNLGNYVVQTFAVSTDTQPPRVTITAPQAGTVSATNTTITGQVTDNLSGVAKLEVSIDGGAYAPVPFDAQGKFRLLTTFATDGSTDGKHVFLFRATDAAGSVVSPVELDFTLDTLAPTLSITSPAASDNLTSASHLTGTVSGPGSAVTALSYLFDGGSSIPLSFDASSGAFDQALDLSKLMSGAHTLTVTARDMAGNTATTNISVTLPAAIPLTVTTFTPTGGSTDIGVTYRPKITFLRAIDTSTLTADNFYATEIRVRSDSSGNFTAFLPPSTPYQISVFDPKSGLIAHGQGITSPSGRSTDVTSTLTFEPSTAPDSDCDGLPDDIEYAVGTNANKTDTDGDGIDDYTAIQDGLNPLGGHALPTGVIASLPLQGTAKEVVVQGSITDPNGQTAYVATGAGGLAIVNVTQFTKPTVLGQIVLPGDSDVAYDDIHNLAAVASNSGGLNLVDVSNPMQPTLKQTVMLPGGGQSVEVYDGLAYVASGANVVSVDLATGEVLQTLNLGGARSPTWRARAPLSTAWTPTRFSVPSTSAVSR